MHAHEARQQTNRPSNYSSKQPSNQTTSQLGTDQPTNAPTNHETNKRTHAQPLDNTEPIRLTKPHQPTNQPTDQAKKQRRLLHGQRRLLHGAWVAHRATGGRATGGGGDGRQIPWGHHGVLGHQRVPVDCGVFRGTIRMLLKFADLVAYLLTCLFNNTHLLTHLLPYLLTHLLTYLFTYLLTYVLILLHAVSRHEVRRERILDALHRPHLFLMTVFSDRNISPRRPDISPTN